jgi:hypothetical protein
MGPTGSAETSETGYQPTPHNIQEEQRPQEFFLNLRFTKT